MKRSLAIIANRNELNSYIHEQYDSLKEYFDVVWGLDFFWEENFRADFYLIHWPEYIANFYNNSFDTIITNLQKRFTSLKKKNAILIGIYHNKHPHYNDTDNNRRLYDIFYSNMDGVICLGYYSADYFKSRYPTTKSKIAIISHPCFGSVVNTISKTEARTKLSLSKNDFVILVFGSLRNKEEVKLFYRGFKDCSINNKRLLVVGGKIDHYSSWLEKIYNKLYKIWHTGKRMKHIGKKVKDEDLQIYFNACDVVLIPRTDTLNSGVLFMALTFGKPIIAPKIGNLTEIIEGTNNFMFNPQNRESLQNALNNAAKSDLEAISTYNKNLCKTKYAPNIIAKEIYDFVCSLDQQQ